MRSHAVRFGGATPRRMRGTRSAISGTMPSPNRKRRPCCSMSRLSFLPSVAHWRSVRSTAAPGSVIGSSPSAAANRRSSSNRIIRMIGPANSPMPVSRRSHITTPRSIATLLPPVHACPNQSGELPSMASRLSRYGPIASRRRCAGFMPCRWSASATTSSTRPSARQISCLSTARFDLTFDPISYCSRNAAANWSASSLPS